MAQARKRRGEKDLSRIKPVKIKRSPPGVAKSKILHLLLELEDDEVYSYADLVTYLVRNGVAAATAIYYINFFSATGLLEKIEKGVYRVNKEAIKKLLEELEY
jgi:butyrate kinase